MRGAFFLLIGLFGCSAQLVRAAPEGDEANDDLALDPLTEAVAPPGVPSWEELNTRGACGWDYDVDLDGSVEEGLRFTTDANGKNQLTLHLGADGVVDSVTRDVGDGQGRVLRREIESPPGTPSSVYTYDYDSEGRRIEEAWDYGPFAPDGKPENTSRYAYDALGRLRSRELTADNGTGNVGHGQIAYAYDDDGLGWTVTRKDAMYSLRVETWSIRVDGFGRLVRVEQDDDSDGHVDQSWEYRYDASGRRTLQIANIGDGPRSFTYRYDAEGRLSTIDYDHPVHGDGKARWTYRYDCE